MGFLNKGLHLILPFRITLYFLFFLLLVGLDVETQSRTIYWRERNFSMDRHFYRFTSFRHIVFFVSILIKVIDFVNDCCIAMYFFERPIFFRSLLILGSCIVGMLWDMLRLANFLRIRKSFCFFYFRGQRVRSSGSLNFFCAFFCIFLLI